jgi:hypothetical protein
MAFVKLEKSTRGSFAEDRLEVRMGAHLQSKAGTKRGVYFSMSETVVGQVGWKQIEGEGEFRVACKVLVQEGVGEDAGFFLLSEATDSHGYALGTTNKAARSYSMSISAIKLQHYKLNEVPMPTAPVEFTIDEKEKTILIQSPDWLRYDPSTYAEPPKPVVQPSPPTKAVASGGKAGNKALLKEIAKDTALNRKDRRAVVAAVARTL